MVISLPYIFLVLYVLCFSRSRYQVSVYRTIGPLVYFAVLFPWTFSRRFIFADCRTGLYIYMQDNYMECRGSATIK